MKDEERSKRDLLRELRAARRHSAELRQNEEWYRTLIEGSFDGIYVQKGPDIVFANSRLHEMLGYSAGELEGKDHRALYHPDYQELIRRRAFARMSGEDVPFLYGVTLQRKDGSFFDGEISPRVISVGSEPGVQVCVRDVSERKQAEEEMLESERRFRTLFETAPDCIFMKDLSLRYTHVNPAMEDLFGIPAHKVTGRTDYDLFDERVATDLKQVDSRVLAGESVEAERTVSINGVKYTFIDIRVPMRSISGEISGLYGISRDVTERRSKISRPLPARFVGSLSPVMRSTLATAKLAAEKGGMVLILGESGVGKDYLARYIHDNSPRRDGPYFAVNCAALPPDLAESELFGHERGAFTGAVGRKRGLLELAEGGTLLLNEIGDLPLPLQAKLLTFLDTRSITRVGGEKTVPVEARLLAATNKNLENEVREGRFRQDLYYRINVLSIRVPPLRERSEDIPGLLDEILNELAAEMQLTGIPKLDEESLPYISDYEWPGNVRELRNVIERSLMLWEGGLLDLRSRAASGREESNVTFTFSPHSSLKKVTDDVARTLCLEALKRTRGKKSEAARLLGISRNSMYRYMKRLGLMTESGTE